MIHLNLLVGLCRLNRLLRCRFRCRLVGPPPIIMVAKQHLHTFKGHLFKTSHLDSLTQGNLGANKDNPFRDNLRPLVVPLFPTILNLLVTQANLLFHKASLVSSKVTLLDKLVSRMFLRTNLMSSMAIHLDIWVILACSRANPPSNMVKHLGMLARLKSNPVNQLPSPIGHSANQGNTNPSKFTFLGRWANLRINQANFPAR